MAGVAHLLAMNLAGLHARLGLDGLRPWKNVLLLIRAWFLAWYIAVTGEADTAAGRCGGAHAYRSSSNTHASTAAAEVAGVWGNKGDKLWIVFGNFLCLPVGWLRLVGVFRWAGSSVLSQGSPFCSEPEEPRLPARPLVIASSTTVAR